MLLLKHGRGRFMSRFLPFNIVMKTKEKKLLLS